jgi:peptidyl-prolyl cis-trans isomerase SurA
VVLESAPLAGDAVVSRIGRIRVADLAAPLQATVMRLDTNQISAPLRAEQGIVLFMVCDREADDLELPGRDQIQRRLELEKLDLLARRYLRDLRRGAFVDIRI